MRRRPTIVCRCGCARRGKHCNNGLIGACYRRWLRAGKPAGGPPAPRVEHPLGRRSDRIEDYAFLRSHGTPRQEAATRVGVKESTSWRYEAEVRAGVTAR
ncbi:hypothetical protein GCM10009530_63330 [Microbispora corallina]|uniref:Uncharacterized protein n=1 Tax=Microbispora corallina TaxID=83302 RepID=A0ABQ4GBM6_9ACTN|nr:hypothetical protein [Microbispora corallina]GIH44437.1 hypothetical protein Mco01_74370 [Microbispora corallina]